MYFLIGVIIVFLIANLVYSFLAISAANERRLFLDEEKTRRYKTFHALLEMYNHGRRKQAISETYEKLLKQEQFHLPECLADDLERMGKTIIELLKSHDFYQNRINEWGMETRDATIELLELKKMMNSNTIFLELLLKHMDLKYVEESTELKEAHFEKIED